MAQQGGTYKVPSGSASSISDATTEDEKSALSHADPINNEKDPTPAVHSESFLQRTLRRVQGRDDDEWVLVPSNPEPEQPKTDEAPQQRGISIRWEFHLGWGPAVKSTAAPAPGPERAMYSRVGCGGGPAHAAEG